MVGKDPLGKRIQHQTLRPSAAPWGPRPGVCGSSRKLKTQGLESIGVWPLASGRNMKGG